MEKAISVKPGDIIKVTPETILGNAERICIEYAPLLHDIQIVSWKNGKPYFQIIRVMKFTLTMGQLD